MLSFAGAGCSGGGGVIMNRPSPSRVWVSGPLQAYAAGFREELSMLGYSARSAAGHLQLMAHLSLNPPIDCGLGGEFRCVAAAG